jgi:hypothetical protein
VHAWRCAPCCSRTARRPTCTDSAGDRLTERAFDELDVVSLWRGFLAALQRFLRHLGGSDVGDEE